MNALIYAIAIIDSYHLLMIGFSVGVLSTAVALIGVCQCADSPKKMTRQAQAAQANLCG
jgi:hypothetical protein